MYHLAYHEQKQHGTTDFPVAYYYVDQEHPQYNMPFHWHKEWEIIHILKGDLILFADEKEYETHAGDVLLLRDGMLHGGTPSHCAYECLVFDLHGLFRDISPVKKYLHPVYRGQLLPEIYYPDHHPQIQPITDELMEAFRHSGMITPELSFLGNISRLFSVILSKEYYTAVNNTAGTGAPLNDSRRVSQLKPVFEYIEAAYSSTITLAGMADKAGMSPKYFCRFFHSITHQTPMDYVNYYRIEQAASLLNSTNWSITAVGLECGFNDSSYFVKVFKKYKGITPRQYRKTGY